MHVISISRPKNNLIYFLQFILVVFFNHIILIYNACLCMLYIAIERAKPHYETIYGLPSHLFV